MALILAMAGALGVGGRPASAASSQVPLESLMVSNLVRLSSGHPGQWQSKTFRRGLQIHVQRFSTCGCDTALFTLHKQFGTLKGQLYVDTASTVNGGQVSIQSASDFTKPTTYVRLWQQKKLTRGHPAKFRVRVTGTDYLLIRAAAPSCCLVVDVIANVNNP